MCTVAAAIPLALGIGQSTAQYVGENQRAESENEYQNQVYSEITKNAKSNYNLQLEAQGERALQEREALLDEGTERARRSIQDRSAAATALGSRGLSSQTMNNLLGEFDRQAAATENNLLLNYNWRRAQDARDAEGFRTDAANRIVSARPRPVEGGNPLSLLFGIGGSAIDAYDTGMQQTRSGPYDPNKTSNDWLYRPLFGKA
jgi:hypothetical protein